MRGGAAYAPASGYNPPILPGMELPISVLTDSRAGAARPFLKWAGGKSQLLDALLARLPATIDTYYEPFVGGGALFFALASRPEAERPRRAVLTDINGELVTTYQVVRDHLASLITRLAALEEEYLGAEGEGRETMYYRVRAELPGTPDAVAARLIFLNKTCYNGLYRVNRHGQFNVPHGRYRQPRILDRTVLEAASVALRCAEVYHSDFADTVTPAAPGDVVYVDPPFFPLSPTSSFTAYTDAAFGKQDQLRLKWTVDELTRRGVGVMLSNSPHEWVVGAYEASHYRVERTPARRAINSRADRRGAIEELIVTNEPLHAR